MGVYPEGYSPDKMPFCETAGFHLQSADLPDIWQVKYAISYAIDPSAFLPLAFVMVTRHIWRKHCNAFLSVLYFGS